MKFKIFISSVQSKFTKTSLVMMAVATNAILPIAAMASPTGTGGSGKSAGVIEPFPEGARVVFFGDSITQNGVAVTWVAAHYMKMFPNGNVRFFNVGISGGSVGAAHLYFDSWLAPLKPTHVVVGFGVNDAGATADYVDISAAFNQDWRLLHARKYSPVVRNSTVVGNGRSWWERHEAVNNRHWPKDYCIPKKLDWPADGVLKTKYGSTFRLGPKDGKNSVFASLFNTFPDEVMLPLSGRARKLAFLSALSTNPNIAWVDAAKVVVEYADGTSQTLLLLPPDNCDDWLNYSTGQWAYYVPSRDNKPYAVKGNPVMFGETAHANVHAITLDPSKELKRLRLVCCGKETIVGILAVTLYRDGCNK